MRKFLKTYNLQKLDHELIKSLNMYVASENTGAKVWDIEKSPGAEGFTGVL